jgi:hypothetical protein
VGTSFRKRSCSNNKPEGDDDSKISHPALVSTIQASSGRGQPRSCSCPHGPRNNHQFSIGQRPLQRFGHVPRRVHPHTLRSPRWSGSPALPWDVSAQRSRSAQSLGNRTPDEGLESVSTWCRAASHSVTNGFRPGNLIASKLLVPRHQRLPVTRTMPSLTDRDRILRLQQEYQTSRQGWQAKIVPKRRTFRLADCGASG